MDYRVWPNGDPRFDIRTKFDFGLRHFGVHRYLKLGRLGVRLWRIS